MNNYIDLLNGFVLKQDKLQQYFGKIIAWGLLSLVVISALIVVSRYGFDAGSIALQEVALYNHAAVFMLGFAYTLQQNEHVRIDVFYGQMTISRQAWIDLFGSLFFALPVIIFIAWSSWDYVALSWKIHESSAEAGGLAYVYLLKTVILIMTFLLGLQSVSLLITSALKIKEYK
jgi:TRAP-type mannitol/chloroaromatic compound transport system permease small subunit